MRALMSCLVLLPLGCSNGSSEPADVRAGPRLIESVLADGELGKFAASGPVPPGQAYWSGVPVPRLKSGQAYVVNAVKPNSVDSGDGRVRVGVTDTAPLGAAPEPPDAHQFAELPYSVRAGDSQSWLSIALEPADAANAKVEGLRIDATLSDGRKVRMMLPVTVAACSAAKAGARDACAAISEKAYEQMAADPKEWGVFER